MRRRTIVEDGLFTAEMAAMIPNAQESDGLCEAAFDYLSVNAGAEEQLEGTNLFYKVIPYPQAHMFIVMFFTIHDNEVILHSAITFTPG